jgi:PAS domain S-box-containing protein
METPSQNESPLNESKQGDEALRAPENQLQMLLDAMPLGAYLVDADFRLRLINATAQPVFGDIPDLIGRDFDEVIHILWPKSYADEFIRLFRHTLTTGEPHFRLEHIEARRDRGVTEYYEWQIHRIPLSDGRFGVVCYFRDISKQVFARQQILESEAKYRTLFDSIDEGFCIVEMIYDDAGQPIDYRFIETNAVFGTQTGLKDAVGKTMLELVPDLEKGWIETYGRVALTGKSARFEKYSAAMKRWFDVYASRIGNDTSRLVAMVFRDITEHKHTTEAKAAAAAHTAFQVKLADALRPLADPVEVQATASRVLGEYLNVNRVVYFEVRDPNFVVARDYVNGVASIVGEYPIASFGPKMLAAYRTGHAVLAPDVANDPNLTLTEHEAFATIQIGAYIGLPLIKSGEFVAGLAVHTAEPRNWTPDELKLVQETAERTWAAVERARAEAALRESESRLQLALDSADAGIHIWDIADNVLHWDKRMRELWGLGPDEKITDEVFINGLHLDDREKTQRAVDRALDPKGDGRYFAEHRVISKSDGQMRWVSVTGQVFFEKGAPLRLIGTARNVTHEKQAEERLRESEERFSKAFNASPLALTISSLTTGKLIAVNDTFVNVTGYTRAEALGKTTLELGLWKRPADREAEMEIVRKMGQLSHAEYTFQTRSGEEIIGLLAAEKIEIGGDLCALTVIQDITERKHAEERLQEQQRLTQNIIEAAPTLTYIYDLVEERNVFISSQSLPILGYTCEEITAMESGVLTHLIHPDDAPRAAECFQRMLTATDHDIFELEYRMKRKDGSWVWLWSRDRIFKRDASGAPTQILGVATDITERKQAAEELETTYYRYRVAEEAAKGFNYEWNLETGRVMRSESIHHIIGYKHEELDQTWQAWWELIHLDDRVIQSQTEAIEMIRSWKEDSLRGEYRVRHKDGHYIWVMERCLLIRDEQGTVRRVIGQTVDITEHKQLEAERERLLVEEQKARAQAEAATRAKDEFLAVVSHELRSPLNAILGYSRLLRTQRRNDVEIGQITNIIERNGRMQIQLIEDLLDTARIISGKLKLDIKPVELTEVVAAALDTVRPAADSKNISLDLAFEADTYQIMGDADRLQQVVWNLLSNAIKFTPEGGHVLLALTHHASAVQIVVSDTGQGISPDLLPFIFDRFRQGDSSSTRRYGGLGLGLALVRHLVELHGGEVKVDSAGAAKGATFTIHLPLRNTDFGVRVSEIPVASSASNGLDQSAFSNPPSAILAGLRVLVVDDEEAARELVALTLRGYGAIAETAESPNVAIAALEAAALDNPFHLLLSDIGMPGEDGYSLIRRVRTHPNAQVRDIRAVALTAYARSEDRLKALTAGFQIHIPKPVEENELITVAASLTGRL